jgi:ABC-type oligopeptide transport system substrate-binding subunit
VIDASTLEITLERPTPYFLAVVAHQTSAPVNPRNVEKFGRAFARPGNLVSNGAFRLAAFTPNDETVLVKNPYFHAASDVKIDREIIASIDDRAAAFLRFRAGEIDTYDDAPADELAFVRETLKDAFYVAPTLGVLYLAFNTKKRRSTTSACATRCRRSSTGSSCRKAYGAARWRRLILSCRRGPTIT